MDSTNWVLYKDIIVALISAGVPSLVALYVYFGWSRQKKKEVVAVEAKDALYNLDRLQNLQLELYYPLLESNGYTFNKEVFDKIHIIREEFIKSITILGFATNDRKLRIYATEIAKQLNVFIEDIKKAKVGNLEYKKVNLIDSNKILEFKKMLLNYALYKK